MSSSGSELTPRAGDDDPVKASFQEPIVVDPETRQELGPISVFMSQSWFSGPLPPPTALAEYDKALPGLARRIVERWEREGDHRQSMERSIVRARITNQSRGQIIGAFLSAIVLAAGIAFVASGKSTAGLVALLVPLGILVGAFVYNEVRSRGLRNGNGNTSPK